MNVKNTQITLFILILISSVGEIYAQGTFFDLNKEERALLLERKKEGLYEYTLDSIRGSKSITWNKGNKDLISYEKHKSFNVLNGRINKKVVIPVQGKTKIELYNLVKSRLKNSVSKEGIIYFDKTLPNFYKGALLSMDKRNIDSYDLYYNVKIEFKDNRFRMSFTNLKLKGSKDIEISNTFFDNNYFNQSSGDKEIQNLWLTLSRKLIDQMNKELELVTDSKVTSLEDDW
jgi:hypothetical protein